MIWRWSCYPSIWSKYQLFNLLSDDDHITKSLIITINVINNQQDQYHHHIITSHHLFNLVSKDLATIMLTKPPACNYARNTFRPAIVIIIIMIVMAGMVMMMMGMIVWRVCLWWLSYYFWIILDISRKLLLMWQSQSLFFFGQKPTQHCLTGSHLQARLISENIFVTIQPQC